MTPEEREAIARQHPMWPRFEAYYAQRHRRRWRRRLPWLLAAAVVVVLLAACGPDKAAPATPEKVRPAVTETARPAATEMVRSGSYCRQAGATGQTDAGRPMVCATTGTDKKRRWRTR